MYKFKVKKERRLWWRLLPWRASASSSSSSWRTLV